MSVFFVLIKTSCYKDKRTSETGVRMDLPAPRELELHDMAAGEKWSAFKFAWESYALAKGITTKDEKIQVATLLRVIGEEARTVGLSEVSMGQLRRRGQNRTSGTEV